MTEIILSSCGKGSPISLVQKFWKIHIVLWRVHVMKLSHVYINRDRLLCYNNKLFQHLSTGVNFLFTRSIRAATAPSLRLIRVTSIWNIAAGSHVSQKNNVASLLLPHETSVKNWHASLIVIAQESQMALPEFNRVRNITLPCPPQAGSLIMSPTIHHSMLKITVYSKLYNSDSMVPKFFCTKIIFTKSPIKELQALL